MTSEDLAQIQALVSGSQRVLVLTHKNPSVDAMASTLAIYLAMVKMGKDVTVAMESAPLVEVANLVGIDQVKSSLSGKNLLITYKPYSVGDFEKVSYMDETGQPGSLSDSFKLTISPREGFVPDPKNFNFSFSGASADLVYAVEVLEPAELGSLYDPAALAAIPIINIDNHDPNKDYGKYNLVEPEAASISEIVTFFLRAVNAQLDADIAGNLYQGIVSATGNFQSPKVAAATFEAAALCLRSGAKTKTANLAEQPAAAQAPQPIPTPPLPRPTPPIPPRPTRPQPQQNFHPQSPAGMTNQGQAGQQIPTDWTQPKAYRGTSVV